MFNKLSFGKKQENGSIITLAPNANIYEQEKDIVIEVEMPSVEKNSLEINLEGDLLTVRGKRDIEKVDKEYHLIHQERYPVEYQRSFEINTDIDRSNIKAEYQNGVVKIVIVKAVEVLPKKIEIKV